MKPFGRRFTYVAAATTGFLAGVLTHAGHGGEFGWIFVTDGEGNVDVGWLAYVLAALVAFGTATLVRRRHFIVSMFTGWGATTGVVATAVVVGTELAWAFVYLPVALLGFMERWPRALRVAAGGLAAAFVAVGATFMVFAHTGYYPGPEIDFQLICIYGAPAALALADAVAWRPATNS